MDSRSTGPPQSTSPFIQNVQSLQLWKLCNEIHMCKLCKICNCVNCAIAGKSCGFSGGDNNDGKGDVCSRLATPITSLNNASNVSRWTLRQTVEECSATWIEHWTQYVLDFDHCTLLNQWQMIPPWTQHTGISWCPMNIAQIVQFVQFVQFVQLYTVWHVDQLSPSDRRWW